MSNMRKMRRKLTQKIKHLRELGFDGIEGSEGWKPSQQDCQRVYDALAAIDPMIAARSNKATSPEEATTILKELRGTKEELTRFLNVILDIPLPSEPSPKKRFSKTG